MVAAISYGRNSAHTVCDMQAHFGDPQTKARTKLEKPTCLQSLDVDAVTNFTRDYQQLVHQMGPDSGLTAAELWEGWRSRLHPDVQPALVTAC